MSAFELVAALLGLATVVLVVRRSVWNYPFAIAMVALYGIVFFERRLYAEAALQGFFLIINAIGWRAWSRAAGEDDRVSVGYVPRRTWYAILALTALAASAGGWALARWSNAALPYPDAAAALTSVAAQLLQNARRVESWWLWIAVDAASIGLFWSRELHVTSALYAVFLIMSVVGLVEWRRKAA